MKTEDLLTFVQYNQWANQRLLRRAAHLSPEQLKELCWLSHGDLLNTLLHIIDAQWSWRLACQEGTMPAERLAEDRFPDFKALRTFWEQEDERLIAFVESLDDAQVEDQVQFRWARARPRTRILWHIIAHIVHHGIQHRSEAGQYLASLGRSPGNLDFIIYVSRAHPQGA